MWGYAIFCEYPGCQRFEAVVESGELPQGWFSVDAGSETEATSVDVGTFCSWAHLIGALMQLAPEDTELSLDITHRPPVRHEVVANRSGRAIVEGASDV